MKKNARPSSVYVMRSGLSGLVKIGRSAFPEKRAKTIAMASGNVVSLHLKTNLRDDASYIENAAHKILDGKRREGEWFEVSEGEAVAAIEAAIKSVDLERDLQRCRGCRPEPIKGLREYTPEALRKQINIIADDKLMAAISFLQQAYAESNGLDRLPSVSDVIRMAVFDMLAARRADQEKGELA